jgi:hypothetical protein
MSRDVYRTITSPDVDVAEFSKSIIASITQVKKQIPRCERAFAKIEASVSLLEGNFDGYYKDFVQSQNPSTIIESFVIDVSNTGGADMQTTRQFRKIIDYYRRATQGKIKDPKIKKVFDMLNSNFSAMEGEAHRQNRNTGTNKDGYETDASDEEETAPQKQPKPLTGKERRMHRRQKQKSKSDDASEKPNPNDPVLVETPSEQPEDCD